MAEHNPVTCNRPALGLRPGAGPLALVGAGLLSILWTTPALSHGVEMASGRGQSCWLRVGYAGGEPMAFAKVKVINPQGQTHQAGNADALGHFAWLPDQEGQWSAVAEDGMGHRGEISLAWARATPVPVASDAPGESPPQATWLARVSGGLSVIFWLSGLAFWWRGRRNRQGARRG